MPLTARPATSTRRSFLGAGAAALALARTPRAEAAETRRSFVAFGAHTYLRSEDGETVWDWPENTRDGWMLPNGNLLLVVTRVRGQHGGRLIEVTRGGETVFRFDGSQDEINTVQPLPDGRLLLTEAGARPRILEIDRSGHIQFELPLDCQTEDTHLQSRMTRKISNGNYLVPLMGEKQVREYTPAGEVVWRADTPHWPFTAIRLDNGNTLVTGTDGSQAFEFDDAGRRAWTLSNDDLPGEPLHGLCGGQRLPNGNTVVTSYRAKAGEIKLTEVSPDKRIVWTHTDALPHGIHHFQILTMNGEPVAGTALR